MSSMALERPRAYHGREGVKSLALARMEGHRAAERLIKKTYREGEGESFRGCMIGCLGGKALHRGVVEEFAIPEPLCHLFEVTFEGLPTPENEQFTVDVLTVIPVGADLSMVVPKFTLWLLTSLEIDLAGKAGEAGKATIATVAGLYARWIAGDNPPDSEWSAAESAAWSARSAAWSARSAAESAAWSARSAAWSARSAAESAAWRLIANQLLVLLRASASASAS